jgi:hypothetical protein
MMQVPISDPFVEELFQRHADVKKPWVDPLPCSHLWSQTLPADLGAGVHTLTVEATDDYGESHTAHRVIEIVDPAR